MTKNPTAKEVEKALISYAKQCDDGRFLAALEAMREHGLLDRKRGRPRNSNLAAVLRLLTAEVSANSLGSNKKKACDDLAAEWIASGDPRLSSLPRHAVINAEALSDYLQAALYRVASPDDHEALALEYLLS